MSMPGADMRPDDGPWTECESCGATIRPQVGAPQLCDECEAEWFDEDDDEEED